jgi:glycosyltransferase involved in cell wall biosynthesis
MNQDRRFVIICPTYNAAETCRQTILSVAAQSYTNWHMIVINDMSTDDTPRTILQLFDALKLSTKLSFVFNTEKKWEIENTLIGLNMCKDDDIVCRLDMDDYLTENNALEIINHVYNQSETIDAIWTSHRWFDENGLSNMNISGNMAPGSNPYKHPWVSSHFKTFKAGLVKGINDANFRGEDGKYFKRIGDQAFMLPALANARNWQYIAMPMYAYRCPMKPETFQTDDAKFQQAEGIYLRNRGYVK